MRWLAKLFCVVVLMATVGLAWAGDGGSGSMNSPEPRRVTLDGKPLKLSEALAEIKKQIDIPVVSKVSGDPEIGDPQLKACPFWKAVDEVAAKANAFVVSYDPVTLQALAPGEEAPQVSYSGIFRTTIKRISTSKDRVTGASWCTVVMDLAWEPGGRLFYLTQDGPSLDVRDEQNNVLGTVAGSKLEPVTEKSSWEVELRLPASPRNAAAIGLLAGKFIVLGTPQVQEVTFKDLTKGQIKTGGMDGNGTSVKLVDADLKKDLWNVKLELEHKEKMPFFESNQSWVLQDKIKVESVKGGVAPPQAEGSEIYIKDGKATLTYRFSPPGGKKEAGDPKDWKLTYVTAGQIMKMPVEFSFKDVKLP